MHWIKHCRATIGLSNKHMKSLFEKVLFHPSFKLEDVSVRFTAQIDCYEQTIFKTKDGWDQYLIHVTEGDSRNHVMYHKDPFFKHYLLCFHHLVSKRTFKLHEAMVFTKVFILPQIPTCGDYKCRCQFQS